MPPASIPRKVEDIIFYYYAKLVIAPSSGFRGNYAFIIDTYKRLKSDEVRMSDYERELWHVANTPGVCAFCGRRCNKPMTTRVVPRSFGVQPGMHNIVYACKACAVSKGERDFVQWWCNDLKRHRDELPRVPLGLYLKIAYELHKVNFSSRRPCQALEELFTVLVPYRK
jgi:hypothetical protein